jgi:alpha-L-fucosidase
MKSFIIFLLFFGFLSSSYSQKKPPKEGGKMDVISLPEIVIKKAGADFSVYIPDKNPDSNIKRVEEKFIAYDLGKDNEGYDEYLLVMQIKKGTLAATYDEKGKLIRVVENYKNVLLPSQVIYSVYKKFPGWTIVNDKFLYTQEEGDIIKKQYNLKIKKNKDVRRLTVRPNGEIVKGL